MTRSSGPERVVAAWDGTLFHVGAGDTIEEETARGGAFEPEVQLAIISSLAQSFEVQTILALP